jgi:hypothetical protein
MYSVKNEKVKDALSSLVDLSGEAATFVEIEKC